MEFLSCSYMGLVTSFAGPEESGKFPSGKLHSTKAILIPAIASHQDRKEGKGLCL